MGIAYLGLKPAEFFELRVGYFYAALDAWSRHELNKQRFTAEIQRMQTTDLLNIQLKKKDRVKPGQLWRFPWDDEDGGADDKQMTAEEIRRHNEEILKRLSNGG